MRKGDIVFCQSNGVIGRIIRYFDKGKFNHVALAVSHYDVIEADIGTRVVIRPFRKKKYSYVEVVDLGLTEEERQEVFESACSMIGTRYDYLQLLWYILKFIFTLNGRNLLNNPRFVICSELVYLALEKSGALDDLGIKNTIKNGRDLTPNQLYDLVVKASKKSDTIKIF